MTDIIKVSIITAVAEGDVIGVDGKLPWHLPPDLKRFKKLTTGNPVIMGRKTFESIGKALPKRTNIVLTKNKNFKEKSVKTAKSLDKALKMAEETKSNEAFIIGGEQVFKKALGIADKIYLTKIHKKYLGDTFFPHINIEDWEIEKKSKVKKHRGTEYQYIKLTRKQIAGEDQ